MSFHVEFHPPGMPGTGQKVCVVGGGGGGGGGWWWFDSKFSVSFGPNLRFRLWIWTLTKLNNMKEQLFSALVGFCPEELEVLACSL